MARRLIIFLFALANIFVGHVAFARSNFAERCLNLFVEDDDHLNACNAAIKQDRSNYELWYARALSFKARGNYDRAIDDLTQVIKLNPSHANAYFNRSEIYRDIRGDYAQAASDNERYLALQYPQSYRSNQREVVDYTNSSVKRDEEETLYFTVIGFVIASFLIIAVFFPKRRSEKASIDVQENQVDVPRPSRDQKIEIPEEVLESDMPFCRDRDFLARLTALEAKGILTKLELEEEKTLISRILE